MTAETPEPTVQAAIQVPGLGLVEQAEPLALRVNELRATVDLVNVLSPLALVRLHKHIQAKAALSPQVAAQLGKSLGAMRSPVQGVAAGMFQAWSLGQALAATTLLDRQWQQLCSSIDRKAAYAVAVLSMYLALISVTVTVGFGIATLP
jgi:hypothetical protein